MYSLIAYVLVSGILLGLYYSFMALGLNLIFGVLKVVNLAHGDLIMLSAYSAFWIYYILGLTPLYSLILVIPLFSLAGLALYHGFVPKLTRSTDPEMMSFTVFFGLSMVLESATFLVFGSSFRSLPLNFLPINYVTLFGYSMPFIEIFIAFLSIVMLFVTYFYLNRTRIGIATKAIISNKESAQSFGINVNKISVFAFIFSLVITSIAGVFSPYIFGSIYPSEGVLITVISFTIIIIGALGNPAGTIVGGLVYGIITNLVSIYLPGWSYATVFVILVIIIIFRPTGLFGVVVREV